LDFEVDSSFFGLGEFFLVCFRFAIELDEFLFHGDVVVDFDVVNHGLVLSGEFVGGGQFLVVDFDGKFLLHLIILFAKTFDFKFVLALKDLKGLFGGLAFKIDFVVVSFLDVGNCGLVL
jgi:hypothetical protein